MRRAPRMRLMGGSSSEEEGVPLALSGAAGGVDVRYEGSETSPDEDGELGSMEHGRRAELAEGEEMVPDVQAVMDVLGPTRLQWACIVILGLSNAADAVEVLAIGYILTVFKDPVTGEDIDTLPGWSSMLASGVFVGMLIGGALSGMVGDSYGRRPTLTVSLAVNATAALLSALTPQLPESAQVAWLVLFRVAGGIGVGGSVPAVFALAAEISPSRKRSLFINVIACFWSLGTLYTALVAYALLSGDRGDNWPFFAVLVAVPAMVACVCSARVLEESPKYLWSVGDYARSVATLKAFAASQDKNLTRRVKAAIQKLEAVALESTASFVHAGFVQPTVELLGPSRRRRTVLVCLLFLLLSFAHYGISSWITDIFKHLNFSDIYATTLFYTLATIPGLIVAILTVDRIGRRSLVVSSMFSACVSAFLVALLSGSWFVAIGAALFNACSACAWNAVDIFSAELFPSHLRGSALGLSGASGRFGSILGTVFNSIMIGTHTSGDSKNIVIVLSVAGASMFLGAVCAWFLPETSAKTRG